MLITYYTRLDVSEDATLDDIKKAYREKAFIYHPDRNNDSEESKQNFIRIQRAYKVLSNPAERRKYDNALMSYRSRNLSGGTNWKPSYNQDREDVNGHKDAQSSPKKRGVLYHVLEFLWVFRAFIIIGLIIGILSMCEDSREKKLEQFRIDRQKEIESSPYYGKHLSTGDTPYGDFFGDGIYDKELPSYVLIKNGSSNDAIVLLYDRSLKKVVRHVYLQANHNYKMEYIPIGLYEMKVYYGNDWNPDKEETESFPQGGFMRNESFSAASSEKDYFKIEKTFDGSGYSYSIYEVTLYKIRNGNMKTKNISQENFFL